MSFTPLNAGRWPATVQTMTRLSEQARRQSWFLAGPTASGKSDVAMILASRLPGGGEIVAMDSMTLYREMDIGTAKPSTSDRAATPHHLLDVRDPSETCSVAEYVAMASTAADDILSRGRTPVFVGGTGLYLRSLLRGLFEGPPADEGVRAEIESRGTPAELHDKLSSVDPTAATAIQPNDLRRTVRALEVFELTGRPISSFREQDRPDEIARNVFWLEPDRPTLHRRINDRADQMMAAGWLEEATALASRTPPISHTARQGLGYCELIDVVEGYRELPEAVDRIKARTRQFAKRQCTWFRNLPECVAVPVADGESAENVAARLLDTTA